MMSMSRTIEYPRVGRKTEDEARPGHHLLLSPRLQHKQVFPENLVLPLFRALEQLRIDVLKPDEDLVAAGPRRLLDEARDLVAERVDLQDQLDAECPCCFLQIDQAVEKITSQLLLLAKLSSVTK